MYMKNVLIIGFVWPEPNATAAGSRMLQLIELFKNSNFKITFVSTASNKHKSIDFEKLSIQTFNIKINDAGFDVILKEINPNIVLFDRFLTEEQFGWRVSNCCPNAIKILDTEDLHFLRKARQNAFKNNKNITEIIKKSELSYREIASIYRSDLTLVISKYELKLLKKTFKIDTSLLLYIPFLLNEISIENTLNYPSFTERKDFISIGNFLHEPNWRATLTLKNDIWPKIKLKLPDAKLNIYGAYASNKVLQLHNEKEGFLIKGWVQNLEDVFIKSRVCLAPLQFGAGLKGKLIDSMLYGTPNVTTSIGAEAMHKKLAWNGFIEDDLNNFIEKSVELYTKEEIWLQSQLNGVTIINKVFSKTLFESKFINKIIRIQGNLANHRLKNFIGSMLQHHSLKSSMYLSKWIEEKNK